MPQDFSGQNLRGRSFKGQNLEGANFSYADIRNADFTGAILTGANFTGAKAGLQKSWAIFFVLVSWVLMGQSGFLSAFAGVIVNWLVFYQQGNVLITNQIAGLTVVVTLVVVFFVTIHQGIQAGLGAVAVAVASVFTIAVAVAGAGAGAEAVAVARAVAFAGAGAVAGVGAAAAAVAVAFAATGVRAVAGAGAFAFAGAVAGTVAGVFAFVKPVAVAVAVAFAFAFAFAGAFVLLSIYIGWQSLKGDEKYTLIRGMAVAFAAFKGTSFRNADLTDANFTGATLKSTDFRKAILIRTCFHKTKKLDLARPGETYLQKAQVPGVLVTGQGQDKIFDRQDLRGVNFKGANLQDASFIGANLSKANLQDANLSRAKLVQTQLDSTDFTGATLTGAYIKDWGITTDTNFDGVRCEYVYMRLPTKENPDPLRKPDNREEVFADGEFGDFIKPIVDTLDLYHNQGVDPRAIAISFKQLAENNPEAELRIVGMEVKGEDKFLLRAKTAPEADKSGLSAEYFEIYNKLRALAEKELQKLIAEKDSRIHSLENMVVTALQRPSFYSNTQIDKVDNMHPNQGGINQNVSDSQIDGGMQAIQGNQNQQNMKNKTSNFNLQGAQFGGGLVDAETVNAHQIGGDITNYNQVARTEDNNSPVKTILILAANPKNTLPLRLDEEVREIDAGLQRAKKRELFDLKQRWAVRVQEVYQSLLDFKPQIVHFSGHGTGDDGLALEDETGNVRLVDTDALARLFELFASNVECVVLNACYSEVQANAIAQHIPYVIGMNKQIGDKAAIKFATGFYNALGAGESVEFAYKLGCNVIQLEGIAEDLTPVLNKK